MNDAELALKRQAEKLQSDFEGFLKEKEITDPGEIAEAAVAFFSTKIAMLQLDMLRLHVEVEELKEFVQKPEPTIIRPPAGFKA